MDGAIRGELQREKFITSISLDNQWIRNTRIAICISSIFNSGASNSVSLVSSFPIG